MFRTTTSKLTGTRLLVVLVAAVVLVGSVSPVAATPPQPPHNVDGVVTDQNGDPVAGVTVEAVHDGSVVASATTDSNGRYDFDVPDPDEKPERAGGRLPGRLR